MLANRSNYLLEMLVWLQTKDATKKGAKKNKPKPYVPDFMKPDKKEGVAKDAEGHTVDDIKSILSLPRG